MKLEIAELGKLETMLTQAISGIQRFNERLADVAESIGSEDRLVSTAGAAKILGVNRSTIGSYVKAGKLKAFYTPGGGHRKYWVSHLHRLVDEETTNRR